MNCMPDTGVSQSIVSAAIGRDANLSIKPTFTELRNASNGVMTLLGEAETVLCNDKHSTRTVVLVASDLNLLLVGRISRSCVSSLLLSLQ